MRNNHGGFVLTKFLPLIVLGVILITAIVLVSSHETRLKNSANYGTPEVKFYDDSNKAIKYSGNWKTVKTSLAKNGSYKSTTQVGASISMNVIGINSFNVIVVTDKVNGYLDIKIDDSYFYYNRDTYSPKKTYNQKIGPFYVPTTGPHTITLTNSVAKSSSSSGNTLMFEGIETITLPDYPQTGPNPYTPTPAPTKDPINITKDTLFADTDKSIVYAGSWSRAKTSSADGGGYMHTQKPTDSALLNFIGGTSFTINTITDKRNGKFNLYLNDNLVGTFDTYGPTKKYNQKIGPFPLSPTNFNRIYIINQFDKNPQSSGNYIGIDSIDVQND